MSAWRDYCSERSLPRVRPRWSGGSRDVREDSPNAGNGLLDATLDGVSFPTANRSRSIPSDPSVAVKGGVVESLQGARPFRTTGSPYGSVSGMRWSRRRTDLTEFSGTTPLPMVECRPSSSHAETISGSDRTLARHSRHAHPANAHLWTGSLTLLAIGVRSPDYTADFKLLEEICRLTGGFFVDSDAGIDRLRRALARIHEQIDNQYILGYVSSVPKGDSPYREVRVEVKRRRGARVHHRQGYFVE